MTNQRLYCPYTETCDVVKIAPTGWGSNEIGEQCSHIQLLNRPIPFFKE